MTDLEKLIALINEMPDTMLKAHLAAVAAAHSSDALAVQYLGSLLHSFSTCELARIQQFKK